jgi:rare lipoprotein A
MRRIIFTLTFFLITLLAMAQEVFEQKGQASFYADKFHGRITANGEAYDQNLLTAAHLTLPFGSYVKVTNIDNNMSVVVRINDRGPFVQGRIIDLSKKAAESLDFVQKGLARVKIEIINPETDVNTIQIEEVPGVDEDEFYRMEVSRTQPAGYGVQIGSFKELVNLMRLTEKLSNKYKNEVTVQVTLVNDVKIYRVIVGTMKSRPEAERAMKRLKNDYPDSFIYTF